MSKQDILKEIAKTAADANESILKEATKEAKCEAFDMEEDDEN